MKRYVVKDKRNGMYKRKSVGFTDSGWTNDPDKATLFKTIGSVKTGMYSYNVNPDRGKIGAKIILPSWVEVIPVDLEFHLP